MFSVLHLSCELEAESGCEYQRCWRERMSEQSLFFQKKKRSETRKRREYMDSSYLARTRHRLVSPNEFGDMP